MNEIAISLAGSCSASDCLATYTHSDLAISIHVRSSVGKLFQASIENTAQEILEKCGVSTGLLEIDDDGALNQVLAARVEAVLRMAGFGIKGDNTQKVPGVTSSVLREPTERHRFRRTRLYVPGNQPNLAINADLFGADTLVFDLEDSVPNERKFEARILVRWLLSGTRLLGKSELAVRINTIKSSCGIEDLNEIMPARPQAILLPKCESEQEVQLLDASLSKLEMQEGLPDGSTLILPIIETAAGVLAAKEIADASERNAALCFGYEDFIRDIHSVSRPGNSKQGEKNGQTRQPEAFWARQMIVLAAHAAGIDPLDSVFSDFEDSEGLRQSCEEARALGFAGKAVIHPIQIPILREAFYPSEKEIRQAEDIIDAYEKSLKDGRGSIAVNGSMVDIPVVERAKRILNECKGQKLQ